MSFMSRNARCASLVAIAASSVLALHSVPLLAASKAAKDQPAAAAPAPGNAEEAGKQNATQAAKRAFDGGVKSYQSGKYQPAVDQLSAALRGGGLASTDMARGLYYRGLAYKKLSKPGLAISDLTSALWLKNGLSDAERQSAAAERSEAYKAAGLGDGNSGADMVAAADPKSESTAQSAAIAAPPASAAAQAPAPVPVPAAAPTVKPTAPTTAGAEGGLPQPMTMGAETATAPVPYVGTRASAPSSLGSDQAMPFDQPRVIAGASNNAAGAAQPETNAAPSAVAPEPKSGVAGFFSNIFSGSGSGSAATENAAAQVTTASTTQPAPQTSSWADTTSLAEGGKKGKAAKAMKQAAAAPQQAAAAPPVDVSPAPQAAAPKVKGGKYKLHIAAVRSRAEADALAQKLAQQYGGAFASRAPTVDEAVIGSMGTFYRVRVGSYATADEPRGLCNTLRNGGYDCLVVSN